MKKSFFVVTVGVLFALSACNSKQEKKEEVLLEQPKFDTVDVHTFARPYEARVTHLNLDIEVDFNQKVISGISTYNFEHKEGVDSIIFDVDGLNILNVKSEEGKVLKHKLGPHKEWLGQPLTIHFPEGTKKVSIQFATTPKVEALQWLSPQQTHDKKHPFLFTQSQAILARTWLPCQDSPGIRYTYDAKVKVPKDLMAVMSAKNPTKKNESGEYSFTMDQPIPSYLMALSVGDITFQSVGKHTGIYAEPGVIEKAVWEFADMENMLVEAEKLYGEYAWERYDLIVLPPSFPFGGMENPRLTFATPTIIAGDRSLTSLIAHELAHSWSGNLVTNETWNDFWLNEGFTVYFERRIMEALYGADYADILAVLGKQDLEHSLGDLEEKDTQLKLDLKDRNPDDGMTDIAYEKGYFFLRLLENTYGRRNFDKFLKNYFETHAFKTMNTEKFVVYLKENLLALDSTKIASIQLEKWIYESGLPKNCPVVLSEKLQKVKSSLSSWSSGDFELEDLDTENWSSLEWLLFIRELPKGISKEKLLELDTKYKFTQSGNSEILAAWFEKTIPAGYAQADDKLSNFLQTVGRRKFLVPLYKALIEADSTKEKAKNIYKDARGNYHAVSTETIDQLLDWQ